MFYAFAPHENDFREWCATGVFPDVGPLTRDFLQHIVRPEAARPLWRHQQEAVLRAIYSFELLQYKSSLLNIVTGGGKTAIIGALIAWLKCCHDIHKFLILCPNTIVRDRLEDDFADARVFREFGFFPPGTEHYTNSLGLHVIGEASGPQGVLDNGILLGNIQQFYQSNISGKRNLSYILRYVDQLAVFNDEAHNTPAPEYDQTLWALSQQSKFRLDTTATPDRADGKMPDSRMIYEYGIADAQAEVPPIIKSIVVYQPRIHSVELTYTNPETGERRTVDEMDEEFKRIERGLTSTQWVTDPDPMRKQIAIAVDRLQEQKRRADTLGDGRYRPLLFVVAISIRDAEQARDMLEKEFHFSALLVTERSDDRDREAARGLREASSPFDAVVSVLMLREGWDVPRVCVTLLLRKFSSPVYGQQVVGRGLRLNVRDVDIQEISAIVDHEKLSHQWLWDLVGAHVRKDVDQHTLFGDEDLPPRRKPQVLVNPDLLIDVPDLIDADAEEMSLDDLDDIAVEMDDRPDWPSILASFEYSTDVEITDVRIAAIEAQSLDGSGFIHIDNPPAFAAHLADAAQPENLAQAVKQTVRDIAADLLADEGIGSNELGYLYGCLIEHVRDKLLGGQTVGKAGQEELARALRNRHRIAAYFKSRPGLVSSIVRYKERGTDASQ
jgi:superfamily II DNA or RNA helicase